MPQVSTNRPHTSTHADDGARYCPSCSISRGTAYSVLTGHGAIVVSFRCLRCGYEWTVASPDHERAQLVHVDS